MAKRRYKRQRYRKTRTVKRKKKRPEKCHVIRTRIDHIVNAKDAARMVCAAIKHGSSKASIDRQVQLRCRVGNPACDCERVLLTLRQVLTIAATVSLAVTVVNVIAVAVPLFVTRLPLLGRVLLRLGGQQAIKAIQDRSRDIEGVFVRVRDEVNLIERELVPL